MKPPLEPQTIILSWLIEQRTLNPTGYWTISKDELATIKAIPGWEDLIKIKESGPVKDPVYMIFNPRSYLIHTGQSKHRLEQALMAELSSARSKARETLMGHLRDKLATRAYSQPVVNQLLIIAHDGLKDKDWTVFEKFKLLVKVRDYLIELKRIDEEGVSE